MTLHNPFLIEIHKNVGLYIYIVIHCKRCLHTNDVTATVVGVVARQLGHKSIQSNQNQKRRIRRRIRMVGDKRYTIRRRWTNESRYDGVGRTNHQKNKRRIKTNNTRRYMKRFGRLVIAAVGVGRVSPVYCITLRLRTHIAIVKVRMTLCLRTI
jgi:hypothetical protein